MPGELMSLRWEWLSQRAEDLEELRMGLEAALAECRARKVAQEDAKRAADRSGRAIRDVPWAWNSMMGDGIQIGRDFLNRRRGGGG